MGGYLGVQQGSRFDPAFLHLTYRPEPAAEAGTQDRKCVVLVGKGLTFDSGGYNLKVGASQIELMKMDMGGCAAVLGTARVIAQLRPDVEVHFVTALCENMVSAEAMRPGDVLVASNKKTIEVLNTDAEGRLTLADALVYAGNIKSESGRAPDAIVDLATLTGAVVVALGEDMAGLYTNDLALGNRLLAASEETNDQLWLLPLNKGYNRMIEGNISDLKNLGTGASGAGSITAALFLQEFVGNAENSETGESRPISWAHIDMAGPVWDSKRHQATGYGVKLLSRYLLDINK